MDAPKCPSCGEALTNVLDLPYGYWKWDGTEYKLTSTSERVDVTPWACAACLTELQGFHPQDAVSTA